MPKANSYCIGSVCKPLSVWSKLFDIPIQTLHSRLRKKLALIEAICFTRKKMKHGLSRSKEYSTWNAIKTRCNNINSVNYEEYGGRGIRMCDEWVNSFEAFYNYVGQAPEDKKVSIDRIDGTKGYEPGNVRWVVNQSIQLINRRTGKNNTSGYKGVCWNKQYNKWHSYVYVNRKCINLGYFSAIEDAIKARLAGEEEYYKPLINN